MDAALSYRSFLRLLRARLRRGAQHSLDHLVPATRNPFVGVRLILLPHNGNHAHGISQKPLDG
jgi:hypothetical protein